VLVPDLHVDVAGWPGARYRFLDGAAEMLSDSQVGTYDGVVVLDGDRKRLPARVAEAFAGARWTGLIDHHRSSDLDGYTIPWLEPTTESTCVMVRKLLAAWEVPLDRSFAEQLYTGIIFDTGAFRYSNTTANTHRVAAELLAFDIEHHRICERVLMDRRLAGLRLQSRVCDAARLLADGRVLVGVFTHAVAAEVGANDSDIDGIVDALQHVEGIEVAALVIEKNAGRTKLSLRSRGLVDVSALARSISPAGGGHAKAAGASIALPVAEALALVERSLLAAMA
jgi:bifunctional oligoribonuclease and PAP phosphatase NrnA